MTEDKTQYVHQVLNGAQEELDAIRKQLRRSTRAQEQLARNINVELEQRLTLGQRVADKVASFGGSWHFIISFGAILLLWIVLNSVALTSRHFDPFPYILLNLILSTLAAMQAPIIMMSQNRQAARDRLQAENDYKVNLKAELEIRHLHEKLDYLIETQWKRLLEIQQIQIELMEELMGKKTALVKNGNGGEKK